MAAPFLGVGYGACEATWLRVDRQTIPVPHLPSAFQGKTVAVLADPHHSDFVTLDFVQSAVDQVNALKPDLILLPGDFVHSHPDHIYMRPCIAAMARLKAPLGVYAVPGNHDHWDEVEELHECLKEFRIIDLTNTGCWIHLDGVRLRLGGVDDLWEGKQRLGAALDGTRQGDCCLLMAHNPDYVEHLRDRRIGLVVSGHTHGGQVMIPGFYRHVPSEYGKKYLAGLVTTPWTQVFVSRGVGVSGAPIRFCCRPEINLLTLVPA
jgi:predicted MPP superfamily phosphohydrolase